MTDKNGDQPPAGPEKAQGDQPPAGAKQTENEWQRDSLWLWAFFVFSAAGLVTLFWCMPRLSTPPSSFYLFVALLALFFWIYFRHDRSEHSARTINEDEVRALFVEAGTVEARISGNDVRPTDYERRRTNLQKEVIRLERLGSANWTHLEVVSSTLR